MTTSDEYFPVMKPPQLGADENFFQTTMKYSPVSMQLYTPDGILRSYNEAFEALFNLDGAAVVNKYNVFEDEKVKEIGALPLLKGTSRGENFHTHIAEYDSSVGFKVDKGRRCWLKSRFFPIKDEQGEVTHFVIMHEDITELRKYQMELEALVAERTKGLEAANKELNRLSNIDSLTSLANRRAFDRFIAEEWNRLVDTQSPLALILCDIDLFKDYNDTYGHLAGDDCLREIAQAVHDAVSRAGNLVARYGGEEFVVVLPNADTKKLIETAKIIQQVVLGLAIEHSAAPEKVVTLSTGLSSVIPEQGCNSPDTLISAADQAMYTAKSAGRNCIYINQDSAIRPIS
ncbi:sensor domain-containing diguanylate cyclase [Marinomonas sp. C2222]|uniref:diguanylate cyclase n=1 Tax=Marinomonas sargassi TaxID=2984494 RepID=A0ABT2YSZ3_9GAMM|nr:sensor domain-containing diguanylate cyclase [Marinomonas sargassi]MCV2403014.1 sensor domain-containing diguanylate cyclase [Marinomonas sargassi]